MTTKERIKRMYEHKEADRVPIWDSPWVSTLNRWHREGLPEKESYVDYFDLDKIAKIQVNLSPRFKTEVIEETENTRTVRTNWGAVMKNFKEMDSTPEFIDYTIKTRDDWLEAKKMIFPSADRIPWDMLKENYSKWISEGFWICGTPFFGFNVTSAFIVGTERFLMAMAEDPEWCIDMFSHLLDVSLALLDMVWDAGYRFDCVHWADDMGYTNSQFFSLEMYRELLKPFHKKAIDWAHGKGLKTRLHSCGNIKTFVPDLIEIGLEALNPLQVKAGMDPIEMKQKYGKDLVLHGGVNAELWDDLDAIIAEIDKVIPVMKDSGGYIFASDHSIPKSVSFDNFKHIIEHVRKVGSY